MGDKLDELGGTAGAPRLRVLLVDDNTNTVRLLTYLFNEAGWEVFGYTSPEEALARLKQQEVDLVVSDFRMYPVNGPDFLLAAEQVRPATPMLVMTAFDDEPAVKSCLRQAGVPSVSKAKGLTEVLATAEKLVTIRKAVKSKSQLMRAIS